MILLLRKIVIYNYKILFWKNMQIMENKWNEKYCGKLKSCSQAGIFLPFELLFQWADIFSTCPASLWAEWILVLISDFLRPLICFQLAWTRLDRRGTFSWSCAIRAEPLKYLREFRIRFLDTKINRRGFFCVSVKREY